MTILLTKVKNWPKKITLAPARPLRQRSGRSFQLRLAPRGKLRGKESSSPPYINPAAARAERPKVENSCGQAADAAARWISSDRREDDGWQKRVLLLLLRVFARSREEEGMGKHHQLLPPLLQLWRRRRRRRKKKKREREK